MDRVSAKTRSRIMSRIRGKDTQPELQVRKCLHASGLRFRLHVSKLPGKPDLVFVSKRTCVFVHGCFWHGCPRCSDGRRKPQSNRSYWLPKIRKNQRRDQKHLLQLRANGWKVLVIWECEIRDRKRLEYLKRAILNAS